MRVDFNTKGDFGPAHDIPSHSGDSNPRRPNFPRCNLCTGARSWEKVVQLWSRAEQQHVGDAGGHHAGSSECEHVHGHREPAWATTRGPLHSRRAARAPARTRQQPLQEMLGFMSFCYCRNICNLYHKLTFMTPDWRKSLRQKPCALNYVLCRLDVHVINLWLWFWCHKSIAKIIFC